MSLVLRPDIPPDKAPGITTLVAVAIRRVLNQLTGLDIGIKWPNDIIVNGRKVCGILTEMHGDMDKIYYIVVGIGINANLEESDFPAELTKTATSLYISTGQTVDRRSVIVQIMKEIENIYYQYIKYGNFEAILDECRRYSVTLNKPVIVIGRDEEFEGFCHKFLIQMVPYWLKNKMGPSLRIISGDVSVRGREGYV